jgi:hypothetical protein
MLDLVYFGNQCVLRLIDVKDLFSLMRECTVLLTDVSGLFAQENNKDASKEDKKNIHRLLDKAIDAIYPPQTELTWNREPFHKHRRNMIVGKLLSRFLIREIQLNLFDGRTI